MVGGRHRRSPCTAYATTSDYAIRELRPDTAGPNLKRNIDIGAARA